MLTGMKLVDLQEAFDTIDHEIFLNKSNCLGFSKTVFLGMDKIGCLLSMSTKSIQSQGN